MAKDSISLLLPNAKLRYVVNDWHSRDHKIPWLRVLQFQCHGCKDLEGEEDTNC